MDNLTDLFKLAQLTRSQPQYGYILSGMPLDDVSNLAEHHYLVTFIGWQLAKHVVKAGANIDVLKVLEFCMIHDLGEIFGGDISMPYAKANPRARKHAKAFEAENLKFLSKFFGPQRNSFNAMGKEIMDAKSDEALIAKIADYLEVTHFKVYKKTSTKFDIAMMMSGKLPKMVQKIRDPIAKEAIMNFVNKWAKEVEKKTFPEILYGTKEI
jgi:5'-deoxynucleotidase YfbR-like HD superfamily hydrolase